MKCPDYLASQTMTGGEVLELAESLIQIGRGRGNDKAVDALLLQYSYPASLTGLPWRPESTLAYRNPGTPRSW
jgi:hypothetical protein